MSDFKRYIGKYAIETGPLESEDPFRVFHCDEAGQAYLMARRVKVDDNGSIIWRSPNVKVRVYTPLCEPLDNPHSAKVRCDMANELHRAMVAGLKGQSQSLGWLEDFQIRIAKVLRGEV